MPSTGTLSSLGYSTRAIYKAHRASPSPPRVGHPVVYPHHGLREPPRPPQYREALLCEEAATPGPCITSSALIGKSSLPIYHNLPHIHAPRHRIAHTIPQPHFTT